MKFRGKMTELIAIRQFAQIVQTLSKCSKQLVLRITTDKLILVLRDASNRGITAWCEVPKENYFCEYNMEGITPEDNEIYMDISSESMASTLSGLRSSQNSVTTLKIKLTKKCVPCLTFEIETQTTNSNAVCVHDIPVSIITRKHWTEYQEPEIPDFDISIGMPDLKIVRQTLERLKNLGPKLTICAGKNGKLYFSAETNAVRSSVSYSDLRIYDTGESVGNSRSILANITDATFNIDVDMKSMLQLVPSEYLKPSKFIFSFLEGRLAHFFYMYGDITLQYCLPGIM